MKKLIAIETKRYSEVLKRILGVHCSGVEIRVNCEQLRSEMFRDADVPELLENWCTNARIKRTVFFNLKQNGEELFGFFDHPDNLWADLSVLNFVDNLAKEGVLRYSFIEKKDNRVMAWFKRRTKYYSRRRQMSSSGRC